MAYSLLEASKLKNDPLQRGFCEVLSRKSPILQELPFLNINATAYSYNREQTLPRIDFRALNEDYTEGSGTLDKITESLAILGGVVDVDRILAKAGGDMNDLRAIATSLKAKSLALRWNKEFIKGNVATGDAKGFDGLQARISLTGSQLVENGVSDGGDALSLANLSELIDTVAESDPDILLMNKTLKRRLDVAARLTTVGGNITFSLDAFGRRCQKFNDIPIGVIRTDEAGDEIMDFDEVGSTGTTATATSIYAVKYGVGEYLFGIQADDLEVIDLGQYSGGNKMRTLVEWFASIAIGNPTSIARLRGITDAAVVA